jgi:hypothetical protein
MSFRNRCSSQAITVEGDGIKLGMDNNSLHGVKIVTITYKVVIFLPLIKPIVFIRFVDEK